MVEETISKKTIIGLTEMVTIVGKDGSKKKVMAKVDSGACRSSIDVALAAELSLGPIIRSALIKSASGNAIRPVVKAGMIIKDLEFDTQFTIADRAHMKFRVLIGLDILKKGFLIDPTK